jgi:hypothetical protein
MTVFSFARCVMSMNFDFFSTNFQNGTNFEIGTNFKNGFFFENETNYELEQISKLGKI